MKAVLRRLCSGFVSLAVLFAGTAFGANPAATPTFSPAPGTYGTAQSVTISTTTAGATIRYTTDGITTPSRTSGTVYSAPVNINATTTLKAIAYVTTTAPSTTTPIGYAAVNGMTTGGAGGQTVTVNNVEDLRTYAGSSSPMIIYVSGTIVGTGSVVVRSNKSIIGLNGATLQGVGLRLFGNSTSDYVRNIIIQNLKIRDVLQKDPETGGGDNDCIGLKYAEHVWVDHCELSADLDHSDWEYYDGLCDISKQSDYVTVSWTKFMNSWKGTGVGGSSDQGLGRLRITYHHNYFYNLGQRAPGYGYGTGHVFNNYFLKSAYSASYSVGSRFGAVLLVENNYFDQINDPILTDIDPDSPGYVIGKDSNIFTNSSPPRVTTAAPSYSPPYEYNSVLTAAANVPAVILAGAGATLGNTEAIPDSAVATGDYIISSLPATVATPTFSPAAGTYSSAQSVTISTTTGGAEVRYTLDSTEPSPTSGTVYSGPVAIGATTILKAIAYVTTPAPSPTVISSAAILAESGYAFKLKNLTVYGDSVTNPTVSLLRVFENGMELGPAHVVHDDIRNIGQGRFSHWGNILYFSASDNSDPRTNGREYTYAIGAATVASSGVATGAYTILLPCATPTFSPAPGTYSSAQSVTISTTTGGATIRYTINGNAPSPTSGTVYSGPVAIGANATLQAIAYKSGMSDSPVASGDYIISSLQQCATPTFSPAPGTYSSAQSVTISTTTSGATVRYTINGDEPSPTSGTVYSGPVAINATANLKAIAYDSTPVPVPTVISSAAILVESGYAYRVKNLSVYGDSVTNPTVSVLKVFENGMELGPAHAVHDDIRNIGQGRYSHWGNILYFSASDNSDPRTNGRQYTYTTVADTRMSESAVATGDYTISLQQCATPTFSPAPGTYSSAQSVTISTTTGGATIRYTINDNAPSPTSGTVYSGPVAIGANATLKAIAYDSTPAPVPTVISSAAIQLDSGYAYKLKNLTVYGDSVADPTVSVLRVFENGMELGPAHAVHDDIRNVGQGRFSHWGNTLYFSASDNSDPRTNGREYTYTTVADTRLSDSAVASGEYTINIAGAGTGLTGSYHNTVDLSGASVLTRNEAIDFNWESASPGTGVNSDNFSVRWTGQVEATVTGSYQFQTESDDGVRVTFNGTGIINNWTDHGPTLDASLAQDLIGGTKYSITVEFFERTGGAVCRLRWKKPGDADFMVVPADRLFSTALPSPWVTQDVGAPGIAGSASHNSGTFTVMGSGADIWDSSDQFRYVYQVASGDCEIKARVTSVQNANAWSKGGVMIRETLNANSMNALVAVTPGNGVASQWRSATGAGTTNAREAGLTAPYWVRVVRTGNSFVCYRSPDGVSWTAMSTQTINMATSVYIGSAVTSHDTNQLCTVAIDNVTVTP